MDTFRTFLSACGVTIVLFVMLGNSILYAALSCSVTTVASCSSPSVVVWRMSGSSNAHAELPSQSTAAYANTVVCCGGVSSLSNTCSLSYATVLKLQSVTNSHVEQSSQSNYSNNACLSLPSGSVSVAYQANNCTGYDTTLGSMTAATNAHVGDGSAYTTKICASASATSLTFTLDSSSESFPNATPGTVVATTSILSITTGNTNGFVVAVQRSVVPATMSLSGDSSVTIPDKTDWYAPSATTTAGTATASTTQPNTLQFRVRLSGTDSPNYASSWWGTGDTTATALFAGISSTSQNIINRSTAAGSGTTAYVLYNLNTPSTQKTGTYTGSLTYTASVNP